MQARDLSLNVDTTSGQPTLLQAFVPELQRLRRNHTNDPSDAFGQQLELYTRWHVDVVGGATGLGTPFGVRIPATVR
jgi:hypothetical protein